ncbi:hypothetical protein AArc1_0670 [Natrarchaeobaculum sulfurireducens]|uniref:Uncharacterized protein n=1 Tax=Natrarchaeobaculum sulfurireducens TaxID=2044521 RepID=A0A346PBW8_9EURY|nr:hypothetical protein AArc1_0670 [Natrarchaeobaculum sulfurireducens]
MESLDERPNKLSTIPEYFPAISLELVQLVFNSVGDFGATRNRWYTRVTTAISAGISPTL